MFLLFEKKLLLCLLFGTEVVGRGGAYGEIRLGTYAACGIEAC